MTTKEYRIHQLANIIQSAGAIQDWILTDGDHEEHISGCHLDRLERALKAYKIATAEECPPPLVSTEGQGR